MDLVDGGSTITSLTVRDIENTDPRFPDQRLTREEALRGTLLDFVLPPLVDPGNYLGLGITIDPAYASFTESTLGSLVPGKRADFVVLSQDIMSVPAYKLLDTKVLATVLDGNPIYGQL